MGLSVLSLPGLLLILGAAWPAAADRDGIAIREIMEEMEHVIVDNQGHNSDGLANAINPCSNFIGGTSSAGEQSTAEWVRLAFHDAVTADVSAGTG
jgi:hypothetical protein